MRQNRPMKMSDLRKLTSQSKVPNTASIEVKMEGESGTMLKLLDGEFKPTTDGYLLVLTVGEEGQ